jgi:uncharacterized protein DUF742
MSIDHDGEDTFADVLNGFSLTGHRSHGNGGIVREATPSPPAERFDRAPVEEETAASVRAYAWTGGRTRSDVPLELETLVSTTMKAEELLATLCTEHQSIARLCHDSQSVAEVAARLHVPLGVVRVLLSDMAKLGLISVHSNPSSPDLELLERVLRGLTKLGKAQVR